MAAWLLLLFSAVLVVVCGVFVAAEFSFLAADRAAVQREADSGDLRAQGVLRAFAALSTQLSGVQIGITVTNLAIGLLSEPSIATLLHAPLRAIGLPDGGVEAVAVTVALIVSTVVTMVLGELVPKNLAIARPIPTAKAVQGAVRAFSRAVRGPIRLLGRAADAILRPVGIQAHEELASARSAQELVSLVAHSATEGTLEQSTARLLTRSLSFGSRRAGDVMTPRVRMETVAAGASVADVIALIRRSGHTRFPVLGDDGADDVVGIVALRQAIAVPAAQRPATTVGAVMGPPVVVLGRSRLDVVLDTLRSTGSQLAVVVDEYGDTDGLVTAEDLLEELVGEVEDEHDPQQDPARNAPDGWTLSGLLRPDEVQAATGIRLPGDGYETLAGLVLVLLGRIPAPGDVAVGDGWEFVVEEMDGRRIGRVRVRPA